MTIVICPGYHPPELTIDFLKGIGRVPNQASSGQDIIIYPADRYPPYSCLQVITFVRQTLKTQKPERMYQRLHSLLFIGFSAGVVAAIGAAQAWQAGSGSVKAVIAIDGWGVPLWGNFPIHRMSHDAFTHWSSGLLGRGDDGFYADPPVGHLDLWRSPQQIHGYYIKSSHPVFPDSQPFRDRYHRTTAAEVLIYWLKQYREEKIT